MITVKRTVELEVEIPMSGDSLANLFWDMDEKDQAEFFNRLGTFGTLVFQLQSITDCPLLDQGGRSAMKYIGEYSTSTT